VGFAGVAEGLVDDAYEARGGFGIESRSRRGSSPGLWGAVALP